MRTTSLVSLIFFVSLLCVGAPAFADGLRINSIQVLDEGLQGESGFTVDIDQIEDCTPDDSNADPEDFFDSFLSLNIQNSGSADFRARRGRIVVRRGKANGGRFRSKRIAPSGNFIVRSDEEANIQLFLADAEAGGKRFVGSLPLLTSDLRSRRIRVVLTGSQGGVRVRLRGSTRVSFREVDRCN